MARVEFVKRLHISLVEIFHQGFVTPSHRRIQTSLSLRPRNCSHLFIRMGPQFRSRGDKFVGCDHLADERR